MSSQNRAGKLGMGSSWSLMCSEPTPPKGGVYITAGCIPYYQVETEQSLIIIVVVVVVLLLFHNNNY